MTSEAQTGAQLGAQAALESDDAMPAAAADTALLLDVMHRHGLDSKSLAAAAGMNQGYFSRVLSGQYPVAASLLRALFEMTRDPAIPRYLYGAQGEQCVVLSIEASEALSSKVRAISRAIGTLSGQVADLDPRRPRDAAPTSRPGDLATSRCCPAPSPVSTGHLDVNA